MCVYVCVRKIDGEKGETDRTFAETCLHPQRYDITFLFQDMASCIKMSCYAQLVPAGDDSRLMPLLPTAGDEEVKDQTAAADVNAQTRKQWRTKWSRLAFLRSVLLF